MSEKKKFDLIVLGGGPGGYPAAIRGAQNGLSVALIEAKELGGTCLNRGCIPSKSLIANAHTLEQISKADEMGISVDGVTFDFKKMFNRKNQIVEKLRKGIEGLVSANKITLFKGFGKFISPKEIKVQGTDNVIIEGNKIIIATGSEPREIPAFPFDYKKIHDSTSFLEIQKLPKKLAIIGGGVIGCEFASLYQQLGVEVTILEMMPRLIPMEAEVLSNELEKVFKKKGINILTSAKVEAIESTNNGITVKLSQGEAIKADIALVSVGRQLNTAQIGLDKAGVVVQENGIIPVNEKMETNIAGIYAVGDIASKWWLAHVATHQGIVAANNASGHLSKMLYNAIPSVIFTSPEIGSVGLSLEDALKQGYQAKTAAFPFQALGKALAINESEGFAQIVLDSKTGQILGAQIIGNEASSLIAEMALAITNELTIESITETIHAHPTLPEVWLEAAFVAENYPLHISPKKK